MFDQLSTFQKVSALIVILIIIYVAYTVSTNAENELAVEDVLLSKTSSGIPMATSQQTVVMNVGSEKEIYVTDIKLNGPVVFAELELLDKTGVNIIKNIIPTTSGPTWPNLPASRLTDGNTKNLAHRGGKQHGAKGPYWMNIKLKSPTKIKNIAKVKIYSRVKSPAHGVGTKIQLLSNGKVVLGNQWTYRKNPATPGQTIREYTVKQ
jgi:hypothetical protein